MKISRIFGCVFFISSEGGALCPFSSRASFNLFLKPFNKEEPNLKLFKRSLFLLLACILLMNTLPIGALASDTNDAAEKEIIPTENTSPPDITEISLAENLLLAVAEETIAAEASTSESTEETEPESTDEKDEIPTLEEAIEENAETALTKEEVQALIGALPTVEEVSDMAIEQQNTCYLHFVEVCDAFYTLSLEDQEQIDMTRMIDLSAYFCTATSLAATLYYQATWHKEYFSYSIKGGWYDNTGAYRSWILNRINCHWIYDTDDGHACYCIRPDMGEAQYYYYYSSGSGTNAWEKQLTANQRYLIRLILLYGYPNCRNTNNHVHNSSHCQAATQLLIHEAVTKCLSSTAPYKHTDNTWSDAIPYSSASDSWYNIYWDILSRIQNDGWLPSWMYDTQEEADAAPIELTYNEDTGLYEVTLVNTSKKNTSAQWYSIMVDEFSYDLPDGITITRDSSIGNTAVGQTITITATPEAMASGDVKVNVTTPYMVHSSETSSYPATVWIYARYSEADSNWYQPMIQVKSVQTDKVYAYMTLTADEQNGDLEILKTSDDGKVSGIEFTITNNDTRESQSATTDVDGRILLTLAPGTYTVTETVPSGYITGTQSQTVTVVSGETATVGFLNALKRFRIELTKEDFYTGHAQGDGTLEGAVYGVYNGSELVDTYTTDAKGYILTDYYPCGNNWTIREISPPTGYVLETTGYGLSVAPGDQSEANRTVSLTVTECPVLGHISVTKTAHNSVNDSGLPEDGAIFRVYLKSAGSYDAADETERDILTTDSTGKATSKELPYGTYIVYQVSGWEGYAIDTTQYEVSITEDGQTVSVESVNEVFKGNLTILKQDKYSKDPLAGASFLVMNHNGFIVAEATTGEDGTATFEDLVYGSYTYQEVKAPNGYQLDETVYDFSITEDGQTITHTQDNCRIPGSIAVRKTDSAGSSLAGATYLLEYSLDNGKTWTPVFSRDGDNVTEGGCTSPNLKDGQLTTGADGTVIFTGLLANENIRYRLTEVKAPNGYSLMADSIYEGTLPVESNGEMLYDISATVRDGIITDLPMTGGDGFELLLLAVFFAVFGLCLLTYFRKKC